MMLSSVNRWWNGRLSVATSSIGCVFDGRLVQVRLGATTTCCAARKYVVRNWRPPLGETNGTSIARVTQRDRSTRKIGADS